MKLAEAFIGPRIAGAERGSPETWVIIHRSRGGFQPPQVYHGAGPADVAPVDLSESV